MTTKESKLAVRRLNVALAKFTHNTFFDGIPVNDLAKMASDHGFDPAEFEGIYCGRDGRCNLHIGFGRWLCFTWHKMDVTGRYEIVAYAS